MISLFLIAQLAFTSIDTGKFVVKASANTITDSSAVQVNPLPIIRVLADLNGPCQTFMFSDSSFVLRTFQKTDTVCIRKFSLIPAIYRKTAGYYQKRVDTICVLNERDVGCDYELVFSMFQSFSNGWSRCTPDAISCGAETTVMDYEAQYKERYENGVCWLSSQQRYGLGDIRNYPECSWSGWVYPYKPFPGRWETASNWLFFVRKSN